MDFQEKFQFRNLREVNVSELKPGNVLSDNILALGMSKGHVLSLHDIQRIITLNLPKVRVFLIDNTDSEDSDREVSIRDLFRREIKAEIEKEILPPDQQLLSISDEKLSGKLRQVIELKKGFIRGERYPEKIYERQIKEQERFKNILKKSSIEFHEETLKIINEYSIASCDLEALQELDPASPLELMKKMESYERDAELFLNAVINSREVYASFVEVILADLLSDIGYKLTNGLLARVGRDDNYRDFLSNHSLQVAVISLITAIELTKMVHEKWELLEDTDLEQFLILSKKLFSLEDMINLGISAFLHDISFKKNIPDLTADYRFSLMDQTICELHPSEGFHMSKKLNLDFEIESAIYQHCERFDGSGFPNGLMPRFFSKYTPVLIFAEYFIESTTVNPFQQNRKNPREFIMDLLKDERSKFDGDVVYAFIRAASMYPVGTWVFMKDEKIGIVTGVNRSKLDRPVVMIFLDEKLNKIKPYKIDLAIDPNTIVNPISFSTISDKFSDPQKEIWRYLAD